MKRRFGKLMLGAGILGLTLPLGALAASPAGATVRVSAINCTANIPALSLKVAVQQPSTSDVTGPAWAAKGPGSPITITTKGATSILPSSAGGVGIVYFTDVINNSEILGINAPPTAGTSSGPEDTNITPVANAPVSGYFYDDNVSDANPPIPMDGVGTDPPKPTVSISQPALVGVPGDYSIQVNVATSPTHLNVAGPIGGAIFSPNSPLAITNTGNIDGSINEVATQTSVTAHLSLGVDAITACAPPASPEFTTHVHTAGSPASTSEPVLACQPTAGTAGTLTISKGFWSGPAGQGDPALQAGGSLKSAVTYDGCVVPDQQSDAWVLSKHGAPAAVALTATKAQLSLKGKNFGDCKLVTIRNAAGESENGYTNSYQTTGTIGTKYTNGSNVVVKVPGTAAAVTIKYVIDENNNPIVQPIPTVTLEARGVVTKGMGVGGNVTFVGELDNTNSAVLSVLGCNGVGPAGAANVFYGAINNPILTGPEAIFQVDRP